MKKKILFLIILLLIPTLVLAKDTCNDNDINIKSIALKELNGFSEEIQESSINNNTINLNLKMYDVGDSSTYDITVENTSDEYYYFTKDSMKLENDYLEYSLKNDSEVILAKEEKTIELKLSYKNKIPNDTYLDTSKLIISLSDKPLENPKTKMTYTFIFIVISLIVLTVYSKINNKSFNKKKILLLISLLNIIPISINALCTVILNVETKIEIENKEAVFLPGSEVNIKMKELAGDDTSTETNRYNFKDESITAVKNASQEPTESNKEEKNIVSTADSSYPIYMWYSDRTIFWWSEDTHPSLNEDASIMFYNLTNLSDISGLENYDSSNTKNLGCFFAYTSVPNLDYVGNWNTSKNTSLNNFIAYNKALINMEGIKNWDVSEVVSMSCLFRSCFNLEEIDLRTWKTDSLTDMTSMFGMVRDSGSIAYDGQIKHIYMSELFNTSKVTIMVSLLAGNDEIEDYSFLKYFDTSNVKNMNGVFIQNTNLKDDKYFKDWDVSKVTNFHIMFGDCRSIQSMDLSKWKADKITDLGFMFERTNSLEELDISNFDTSNVTTFRSMFEGSTKLKHIYVGEKWTTEANTNIVTGVFPTNCELPNFSKSNPSYRSLSYAHYGEGGYLTLKMN